jgi:hypothetical protein
MPSSRPLFLLLLVSCAAADQTTSAVSGKKIESLRELKEDCEARSRALACARYGYLTKDFAYTGRACELGDQGACFNLEEQRGRAPNQNFALINSNHGVVYGCYVNHSTDSDDGRGTRTVKEVVLNFLIDSSGKLANLTVDGDRLSEKFKDCVLNSFSAKKFVASDREQSIRYALEMPGVVRDRRLDKRPAVLNQ